ncbi:MAG: maltose alpha-D-glucosyltransferase, partial [Parvularcula sp.]|nr:maltose alpha-D-glucosyltransferase [Parvularcula sp.]
QSLGVTALWLLPFYPSPGRDDGYDIADYTAISPELGTLEDFKQFLAEAQRRGLRVITELVLNHTSDQHPWFQRARHAPPGSRERDYYVWSETPEKYLGTRIIFKDFETSNWTWDPVAKAYFWHRFYSHQPDLNFENEDVQNAMMRVVNFWFELGVDGLRLDAVPYLYEEEGTNCESLPETHAYLKKLRAHVDAKFQDRMLLAEANQWPEEVAEYLGPDECHMAFHFPIMPRMFLAVHIEDRFPIADILAQLPKLHETCQWALFLRNHDELTLEMVADEERESMYKAYAVEQRARINMGIRRRLAPLLNNDRRSVELMTGILFSLPGTPVVYYADEIGMGDNMFLGDRDGVRTPMQWSADRNAGFSRANPQRLILPIVTDPEYHYEAINVEAQEQNPNSLLWWTRRMIAIRKRFRAFGRGTLRLLHAENSKVLAYCRELGDERIVIVANLSRFAQHTFLDMTDYLGMVPREVFGDTHFPRVSDEPYSLTLGPRGLYWFALERESAQGLTVGGLDYEPVRIEGESLEALSDDIQGVLRNILPRYLPHQRWWNGGARIRQIDVVDRIEIPSAAEGDPVEVPPESAKSAGPKPLWSLYVLRIDVGGSDPETLIMPLSWLCGADATHVRNHAPQSVLAFYRVTESGASRKGVLAEPLVVPAFRKALVDYLLKSSNAKDTAARLTISWAEDAPPVDIGELVLADTALGRSERWNTILTYDGVIDLKLYRKLDEGESPEVEIARYLTAKGFAGTLPYWAKVTYHPGEASGRRVEATLAVIQGHVHVEGDAWTQA